VYEISCLQEKNTKLIPGEKLKNSNSSVTLTSVCFNDFNIERNQALKNIIKEKEQQIGIYKAALTDLKTEYDKLRKRLFEYEQGD